MEGITNTIKLESVLARNPRLVRWTEEDDQDAVFELPDPEFEIILEHANKWDPEGEIQVFFLIRFRFF